jgi:hypothetical protein
MDGVHEPRFVDAFQKEEERGNGWPFVILGFGLRGELNCSLELA